MAKPNEPTLNEPDAPWGTWEELLLACAVNRYGTNNWDSVAVEIQKRSSTIPHLVTPKNCEQKYNDLKRRYNQEEAVSGDDDGKTEIENIPWLDELRNLRVAELKRELERYDLSIVSLQMKVKRLKAERENGEDKSDLEKSEEREEEKTESKHEPDKLLPELISGKSDRDNQSVNESNSTDPKGDNVETGTVKAERETEPVRTEEEKTEPEIVKPVQEDSCNGSSDSIAKEPVFVSAKVESVDGQVEPELESVAESEGGTGDGAKESSDVQSSASKLRKEGSDKVLRGSSIGDEPENEDHQFPGIKVGSGKSQPLVDFLESVRSHKLGSVFGSRLSSQESPKYKNLIRQHLDLETIQTRLDAGFYSNCTLKFYRDILLLVNNALVFFDKKSSESLAATELRLLISKEMAHTHARADSSTEEKIPPPLLPLPSKQSGSLLLKPKIGGPVIACRKRSSIAAKASASIPRSDRKKDQTTLTEEKPLNKSAGEENQIIKKRTRDGFSSGSRNAKKNGKNRTSTNPNKHSETLSSQKQGREESPSESLEPKNEKKKNPNMVDVKKQGAANFLNRMKRSLSSNNGDKSKNVVISVESDSRGAEQKRSVNSKLDGKKEQISKRSMGGRQQKEKGSPKRVSGRPPKRAAAPPPPPLPVSSKRNREVGENDTKQPRKRSRK
ncbi:hypothetical protein LguiB_004444 [Lonicera macranthoides]